MKNKLTLTELKLELLYYYFEEEFTEDEILDNYIDIYLDDIDYTEKMNVEEFQFVKSFQSIKIKNISLSDLLRLILCL